MERSGVDCGGEFMGKKAPGLHREVAATSVPAATSHSRGVRFHQMGVEEWSVTDSGVGVTDGII